MLLNINTYRSLLIYIKLTSEQFNIIHITLNIQHIYYYIYIIAIQLECNIAILFVKQKTFSSYKIKGVTESDTEYNFEKLTINLFARFRNIL